MPSRDYQLVFRGRVAPGTAPETARANLAKLFKAQPAQVEKLFDGRRQVLKKGLEREAADRYRAALRKAGIIVSVVSAETERSAQAGTVAPAAAEPAAGTGADLGASSEGRASFVIDDPAESASRAGGKAVVGVDESPAPAAEASKPVEPAVRSEAEFDGPNADAGELPVVDARADENTARIADKTGEPEAGLAPVGVQLVAPEVVEPLTFDLGDIELADPEEQVDDTPRPQPLEVDTSALSASDEFTSLDEAPPPPAPELDLSGLEVASEDMPVDPAEPPPAADIDVSGLSAEEGFDSLDPEPPPPKPAIDTSHMELLPGPESDA